MIITRRTASLTFTTDPTAATLRTVLASNPMPREHAAPPAARAAGLDVIRCYPALFAEPAPSPATLVRALRAVAFRLSVVGAVALTAIALHG